MVRSKDEMLSNYHDYTEFYEHLANLHEKTQGLYDEIFNNGATSIKLIELRLAEIFSLYNLSKLFLSLKPYLYHYEFTSLLSFWDEAYLQAYLVVRDNDQNTSWMHERFQNYCGQFEIAEEMLKSKIKELRELLE